VVPRFTVVIPAFNEARYLGRTLESLQRQDFTGGVEIIVVDNASTDGTAAIAAGFGAQTLYEPNPGVCWARQRGTAAARGDIVVSTDADTTHPVDWLTRIDAVFAENIRCVAVAGPCRFVRAPAWARIYPRALFGAVHTISRLTGRVLYVTATNLAFRRAAFTGYDTALTQGGDELDQLQRLRRHGRVIFDRCNVVSTSARRLQRGLCYNVVVTLIYYYLLGYHLNRLFARQVIATAPHIGSEPRTVPRLRYLLAAPIAVALAWIAIDPHNDAVIDTVRALAGMSRASR
jgi:glycosyltransferase involved in cell wall biosynthesis